MTRHEHGFALPTILIASVVMLIVLISTVSATASIRSALDNQYYSQLAREAAESGLARANACLGDNSYVAQWSTANPLRPNTTCTGGTACTNADSCFVTRNGNIRTTFAVSAPTNQSVSQVVVATGKVELTRTTAGDVWRTFNYSASGRVGIDLSLNTVAFGYLGATGGAYFATIAADGSVRAAGYNGYGQLGNGTTANALSPATFSLPATERPSGIYTNFVSGGSNMFVITNQGSVYGAGQNTVGQLGDASVTNRSTPVKFILPAGKTARNVLVGGVTTYVTTTDNNIYAAGECDMGRLGSTYTIAGCADKSTAVRVALPAPTSDLNTQPTNEMVTDRQSVFVRMAGGRVYGWGTNDLGQFANGGTTDSSTPVQIGTYGNSGQPKAVSIAFDGDTLYVVDDSGVAKAAGKNIYGQLGGDKVVIHFDGQNKCIDDKSGLGTIAQFYTCNGTVPQQWTFRSDNTLQSAYSGKCIQDKDGHDTQMAACSTSVKQKFVLQDDGTYLNPATGKCFNNSGGDGVTLILYTCNGSVNEVMSLPESGVFHTFPLPAGAGDAIKVTTDQWFTSVLTDTGQVYSAGSNARGQLGNGATDLRQPFPVKFILPAGVTATDMWTAAYGVTTTALYHDTFVVGSDGKVYGAGANTFGQLGDGTTTDRATPVAMTVINGTTIRAQKIQSGFGTSVILTTDKKVYTVGNNASGQLGDGTTTNSSTPRANRYTNVLPLTIF
jgi:alpha-tubulin suppressor-like RCC1 family protein